MPFSTVSKSCFAAHFSVSGLYVRIQAGARIVIVSPLPLSSYTIPSSLFTTGTYPELPAVKALCRHLPGHLTDLDFSPVFSFPPLSSPCLLSVIRMKTFPSEPPITQKNPIPVSSTSYLSCIEHSTCAKEQGWSLGQPLTALRTCLETVN